VLGHQRQAIAFVGVIYRDDVDLGAQSRTSASHGGSKAKNGEATDDTNYSHVPGGPAAHPLRKNGSAIPQCQTCPIQFATEDVFQHTARIVFDIATSQIEVAEVADAVASAQQRRHIGVQEAADLTIGCTDADAVRE
jgi:hypothetical protein